MTLTLRAAALSALFAATSCCSRQRVQCWDGPTTVAFALPAGSVVATQLGNGEETRRAATGEVLLSMCNNAFDDLVKGEHCPPLIERFCAEKCANPPGSDECRAGQGRDPVKDRCVREALPGFRLAAKTCASLVLEGDSLVKAPGS